MNGDLQVLKGVAERRGRLHLAECDLERVEAIFRMCVETYPNLEDAVSQSAPEVVVDIGIECSVCRQV